MHGLTRGQLEYINTCMNACQWRIDDLVCGGMSYEEAKNEAVRGMMKSHGGPPSEEREALYQCLQSLGPPDLSKAAYKAMKERFRKSIEKSRGRKMGLIEKVLYSVTGMTF